MKLNHNCFGILVDDIGETIDFYTKVMGYGINEKNHDGVTFTEFATGGPITFFAWRWDHLVEHLGPEAMGQVKHRAQSAIYFDDPAELDAAYEELRAKGVHFIAGPKDWVWNARAAYFVDEEGYMWELYSGAAHPEGT